MSIEFVDFKNEYFVDFKPLILPNVYHELVSSTVMDEDGLFCIGALDGEKPVGALIARLSADSELDIASIVVDKEYRRQQIGSALIDYLMSETLRIMDYSAPAEDPNINIIAGAEYALNNVDFEIFQSFLESKGFTMQSDFSKLLYLEPEVIEKLALRSNDNSNAKVFAADDDLAEFDELMQSLEIQIDEKLCFYTGSEEDPAAILTVVYGFDGLCLVSQKITKAATKKELEDMLYDALSEISKKYKGEPVVVNMECNISEFYDLLKEHAEIYSHAISMAIFAFPSDEEVIQ